ncbi:hypothetical protein ACFLQK_00080 [bacterium]
MRTSRWITPAVAFAIVISFTAITAAQNLESAQAQKADYGRLVVAIEQAGFSVSKPNGEEALWVIDIPTGKEQTKKILVKGDNDVLWILNPILQKPEKITPEFTSKILDIDKNYHFIKLITDDQFVYLRIDTLVYGLDKNILNNFIARLLTVERDEVEKIAAAAGMELEKPAEGQ